MVEDPTHLKKYAVPSNFSSSPRIEKIVESANEIGLGFELHVSAIPRKV